MVGEQKCGKKEGREGGTVSICAAQARCGVRSRQHSTAQHGNKHKTVVCVVGASSAACTVNPGAAQQLSVKNTTRQKRFAARVPVAHVLVCLVEVLHVLLHHVAGGDVSAAAKPPLAWDAVPLLCLKVPAGNGIVMLQKVKMKMSKDDRGVESLLGPKVPRNQTKTISGVAMLHKIKMKIHPQQARPAGVFADGRKVTIEINAGAATPVSVPHLCRLQSSHTHSCTDTPPQPPPHQPHL